MIIIITRNTVQKTLILQTVRSMTIHPTADEIYESVSAVCPGISKGTVYRDLNRLAESGEIRRVAIANAPDRYDLTVYAHAHCHCTVCGRVFDYPLRFEPDGQSDFTVTGYELVVNGVCRNCMEERNG